MRKLLVLGAGTAGTMVVNKLRRRLDRATSGRSPSSTATTSTTTSRATCSSRSATYDAATSVVRPRHQLPARRRRAGPRRGRPRRRRTRRPCTSPTAATLDYDYLVIATGTTPRPDQTPGHARAASGARASSTSTPSTAPRRWRRRWPSFDHGRLVVHITEMPIKCPVAPLEFTFLAEAWLREHGLRDRVELVFVTPLDGAFTKPVASERLGAHARGAQDRTSSPTSWSSGSTTSARRLVSYDEREVPFDLLVTVPLNMGADFVGPLRARRRAELRAGRQAHAAVARRTTTIFALGDATDIPASKAGSVAHFAVEVFVDNFLEHVAGRPMTGSLRRPRQLLRRVRRRQGAADRLQLRHRAAARQVPAARTSAR